ncbi:AtpZ/AtpI family protein [Alteromonadaceae bacterium BrNp21-10]|nr:AtpZ/AtpI family protein [Alteromonadaceae bacterium BrNp21-10]
MDNKLSDQQKQQKFADEVGKKAHRKMKARSDSHSEVWFGLGMMGLIGWSISVPTLIGIALGMWLDKIDDGPHSWTMALLVAGLCIGCFVAWHWVTKERQSIHQEDNNDDN